MKTDGIPILTYHSIDDSGSVISTSPDRFRAQMDSLATQGFQTLTLSEALAHLTVGTPAPERSVVITFDDGYQNIYTEAFAAMADHGFKATIFLIADQCDAPGLYTPPGGLDVKLRFMRWTEIHEMQDAGFEMGAHTRTHPDLTRLSRPEAYEEIVTGKTMLEDALGSRITTFAYPFGYHDAASRDIVREHFSGAVSTRLGRARRGDDLYALPRFDMYYLSSPHLGPALRSPWTDAYLFVRQRGRDLRHYASRFAGKHKRERKDLSVI